MRKEPGIRVRLLMTTGCIEPLWVSCTAYPYSCGQGAYDEQGYNKKADLRKWRYGHHFENSGELLKNRSAPAKPLCKPYTADKNKEPLLFREAVIWSEWQDLNLRPLPPQSYFWRFAVFCSIQWAALLCGISAFYVLSHSVSYGALSPRWRTNGALKIRVRQLNSITYWQIDPVYIKQKIPSCWNSSVSS